MEDALVQFVEDKFVPVNPSVLILVVMEDALVRDFEDVKSSAESVLILVVMEDALVLFVETSPLKFTTAMS